MAVYAAAMKEPREMLVRRLGTRTQKELAEEIGVSQAYLCDVLKGNRSGYGKKILIYLGLRKATP